MKLRIFFTTLLFIFINRGYGQEISYQSTNIIQIDGDNNSRFTNIIKASVACTDTCSTLIFFTEDSMNNYSVKKALHKKMLRRYNDFSLSMLAWEANMHLLNPICLSPCLLVKLIEPGESFEIFFYSKKHDDSTVVKTLTDHLLRIKIQDLNDCGFNNFIEGARIHNFLYTPFFITLDFDIFYDYMNKNEKKMIIQTK